MTISTRDQAIAGALASIPIGKNGATMEAIGVAHSLFYTAGQLGAAVAPSPGINGAALTSYAGQVPFVNPTSPALAYLYYAKITASQAGTLILADRLWHNSGIAVTTTTAQSITPATLPARDRNGTSDGAGVMWALEASTATTNASAVTNTTLTYTDSAGNASNTATMTSWPATAVAGTFVPFNMAAGDVGGRAPTAVTLGTSYGAGAVHLVGYRELARINIPFAGGSGSFAMANDGRVQCFDNTVPFLIWVPTATTALVMTGHLAFTHG